MIKRNIIQLRKDIESLKKQEDCVDLYSLFGNRDIYRAICDLDSDDDIDEEEYQEYLQELRETPNPKSLRDLFDDNIMSQIINEDLDIDPQIMECVEQ